MHKQVQYKRQSAWHLNLGKENNSKLFNGKYVNNDYSWICFSLRLIIGRKWCPTPSNKLVTVVWCDTIFTTFLFFRVNMKLILIFQKLFDVTLSNETPYKMERNRFCHFCSANIHTHTYTQINFHLLCIQIALFYYGQSWIAAIKLQNCFDYPCQCKILWNIAAHTIRFPFFYAPFTLRNIIRWQSHWSALTYAPCTSDINLSCNFSYVLLKQQ